MASSMNNNKSINGFKVLAANKELAQKYKDWMNNQEIPSVALSW